MIVIEKNNLIFYLYDILILRWFYGNANEKENAIRL